MLTPELMGALALAVMWTATLLIVAVSWGDLEKLLRRKSRLDATTFAARIIRGAPLAELEVSEVGRAKPRAKRQTILFHPRWQRGHIEGGAVAIGDRSIEIPPLDPAASEVWPRAAAPDPGASFDDAYREASRTKGISRTVKHVYREGEAIFVSGELRGETLFPAPDPTRPGEAPTLVIAPIDPRDWYARKIALSFAGIAGFLGSAAAVTALALFADPAWVNGAALLGIAQFLGAQPLGVALRDAVRAPDRAIVHHDWSAV